jgi:hypothetical protein
MSFESGPDDSDRERLTLKQAAERFGLPIATLREEGARGRLTVYQIGKWFYTTPADVDQMVRRRRIEFMANVCRRHAAACGRKAQRTDDPVVRELWIEREKCWANMEESYTLSAQISFPLNGESFHPKLGLG